MVIVDLIPVIINGHTWYRSGDRTTGGVSYPEVDIRACGGRVPCIVRCGSTPKKPKSDFKGWLKNKNKNNR